MNTKILIAAMIAALIITGCAKRPHYIAAIRPGLNPYLAESCSELDMEQSRLRSELAILEYNQNSQATRDAWGVLLAGLLYIVIRDLSGYVDREEEIAIMKGKLQHIREAKTLSDCGA